MCEYTEYDHLYKPTYCYRPAYGPSNQPQVPAYSPPLVDPYSVNPYGYGQIRSAQLDPQCANRYVRGYDQLQLDKPLYEQWSNRLINEGVTECVSTSSKSKRAKNVNLLNNFFLNH